MLQLALRAPEDFLLQPANERIRQSAYAMARGELEPPSEPGFCLRLVRLVLEHALWASQYQLYRHFLPVGTSKRQGPAAKRGAHLSDPWAADLEASMKYLQLEVSFFDRLAGDLVFNHLAAPPMGHVGILVERGLVLESVNQAWRPQSIHLPNHVTLTPIEHFPMTLVARLPQEGSLYVQPDR